MLIDTTIIHRHGGYDVLGQRQTVTWPNGTAVGLHLVQFHGHTDLFLRATQTDDMHWLIVDLRRIARPGLEADVKSLPARDHDGVVMYALRLGMNSAAEFTAAALRTFLASWFADSAAVPA